jgi:DNA-binding response OmpR family regulator
MLALIAESDKETEESITLAFKICLPDCQLETTCSGKECLEIARSRHPDIVILNRHLSEADSFDVIRQIRSFSEVPIVFLSNIRDESEAIKALEIGGDAYINRPIRQLEFMAHVRALLRKNKSTANTNNKSKRRAR